jgi:FixJ family two-component response regulator
MTSNTASLIYIVDDDASILKAYRRLLESEGFAVKTFLSAMDYLAAEDPDLPGCLVLDVQMPQLNGIDLQARLLSSLMPRPIVFISGKSDIPTSVKAMKYGAVDFLTKPIARDELIAAVQHALLKDASQRTRQAGADLCRNKFLSLTPRERQVFAHVVKGRLNKQIADDLRIAEKTVKIHRGRMMHKIGVRSVAELVRFAAQIGDTEIAET